MLPAGHVINCPHCGYPLYRITIDILASDDFLSTLPFIPGIYPQPMMTPHSRALQTCFKCKQEFEFKRLVAMNFAGGSY